MLRVTLWVLIAALLLSGVGWAAEKAAGPREIAEKFVAAVKAGKFPEAARDKVLELWAVQQKAKDVAPDFIDDALRVLEADYMRAALRVDAERLDEAGAILEKLIEKPAEKTAEKPTDKYLAAAVEYQFARIAVKQRLWELAVTRLEKLRGKGELADFVLPKQKIEMMTAQAYSRVARVDEAIAIAKTLAETDEGRALLARLEVERDGATLDDVEGTMGDVKKRLDVKETGRPTQEKQDKVIAMLDKLIEEALDRENQNSSSGGGGGGGGGGGQGGQAQGGSSGPPSGTGVPSSPATHSALVGGKADDEGKAASTATMGDFWARLDGKDRARVLDALRKQFPRRYRELIEAYYRSLAEGEKK